MKEKKRKKKIKVKKKNKTTVRTEKETFYIFGRILPYSILGSTPIAKNLLILEYFSFLLFHHVTYFSSLLF